MMLSQATQIAPTMIQPWRYLFDPPNDAQRRFVVPLRKAHVDPSVGRETLKAES
jgi:hypothetical protein